MIKNEYFQFILVSLRQILPNYTSYSLVHAADYLVHVVDYLVHVVDYLVHAVN